MCVFGAHREKIEMVGRGIGILTVSDLDVTNLYLHGTPVEMCKALITFGDNASSSTSS